MNYIITTLVLLLFLLQSALAQLAPRQSQVTVTITATPISIVIGQYSILNWKSTNANSCSASGGWSGTQALSGTLMVTPTQSTVYNLTCSAGRRLASASATVTVVAPTPTVTIAANPISITVGQSSTLTWSSTNATSCSASGDWSGSQPTSGSLMVSPMANSTYTLVCTGSGGSASSFASVVVTSGVPIPSVPNNCGLILGGPVIFCETFDQPYIQPSVPQSSVSPQ